MEIKKILLPVDGSEHSQRAARYASELAMLTDAEILLLHCHKPYPAMLGEPYLQRVIDHVMNTAEEVLEPYRAMLTENGNRFTDRILQGPAGKVISEVADIEKCDLIAMGSRGHSELEGLLLGSVTHRVLHSAHCPVLVVR